LQRARELIFAYPKENVSGDNGWLKDLSWLTQHLRMSGLFLQKKLHHMLHAWTPCQCLKCFRSLNSAAKKIFPWRNKIVIVPRIIY
jgi:hypothetical protein